MDLETFKTQLKNTIKTYDEQMILFKHDLENTPHNALRCADRIIALSARASVAKHYLDSIEAWEMNRDAGTLHEIQPKTENEAMAFIAKSVLRNAITNAAQVKQTSGCANFNDLEESAYYAELARDLNGIY